MQVKELMSKPVVTCRATDALDDAARLMWERDCGALPVVGGDGRVVGMITDRDVCMGAFTQGRALREIPVSVAMVPHAFTCRADDSVQFAEALMADKKVRRLPVVDDEGRPLGLLSLDDLAQVAVPGGDSAARELATTLGAIGEPRTPAARQRRPAGDGVARTGLVAP
jgi:CBS domain-containing protein